jgi:hypothetical protein
VRPCRPCWCCESHCHGTSGSPQDATPGAGRAQDVDTRRHALDVSRRWVAVQQPLPGTQRCAAACLQTKTGRALVPPQAAALTHWGCQQAYCSSDTECCAPHAVGLCQIQMPQTSLPQWCCIRWQLMMTSPPDEVSLCLGVCRQCSCLLQGQWHKCAENCSRDVHQAGLERLLAASYTCRNRLCSALGAHAMWRHIRSCGSGGWQDNADTRQMSALVTGEWQLQQ